MNKFTPLKVNITPSLSLLAIYQKTYTYCNNNSQQQVGVHYLISAMCARREKCSQRETTCCQEMHLNSPLRLHNENANQFFQRQITRGARKGENKSEGAAHAANIRGEVRRGLLCSCSFFTLATKTSFSLAHICSSVKDPTCSALICFIWRERKL